MIIRAPRPSHLICRAKSSYECGDVRILTSLPPTPTPETRRRKKVRSPLISMGAPEIQPIDVRLPRRGFPETVAACVGTGLHPNQLIDSLYVRLSHNARNETAPRHNPRFAIFAPTWPPQRTLFLGMRRLPLYPNGSRRYGRLGRRPRAAHCIPSGNLANRRGSTFLFATLT